MLKTIKKGNPEIFLIDEVDDKDADIVDVEIRYKEGIRYFVTFTTLNHIRNVMQRDKKTGESNNGQYFWASDLVIVDEITEQTMIQTIEDIIRENNGVPSYFQSAPRDDEDD